MNSDGAIRRGNPDLLKSLGFNIPLTDQEAFDLDGYDETERLAKLLKMRSKKEKFPGQSTAYLAETNNAPC